jgi:hypothetical protein
MVSVSNPFVDYLSRYTTASPDHEAAFDEFLAQAAPPAAGPLQLQTKVETFLRNVFARPDPPSVILTGNAGDGKTYLCRQLVETFSGAPFVHWDTYAAQTLERDGIRLHVVKDLSELGEAQGRQTLHGLAAALAGTAPAERYLIAANEGRLRSLLSKDEALAALYGKVDAQLCGEPADDNSPLVVINLTRVTTSSFVPAVLRWMTDAAHWSDCGACPIVNRCPVRHNATRLSDAHIAGRVQLLYQLLEHLDIHVTVRDMLIHLAYTIAADQRCGELQRRAARNVDMSSFAYYQTIWGRSEDTAFRRKAAVVQHLDRLRIGDHSLFAIDDFIVSGGETDAERATHRQIFAPAVDLNGKRFDQDRRAYLHGDAERSIAEETSAMLTWLPHARRKLFFEWTDVEQVNQLIPFLYIKPYMRLLNRERGVQEDVLRRLVVGLNRAFARLYLRADDYLYVTTQYLHSGEQPRPLVRLQFPLTDLALEVCDRTNSAYDCDRAALELVITPPAHFRRLPVAKPPQPVRWSFGLLQFEYLLRLANGGTFNILAEECELDVRSLKDTLLRTFADASTERGEVAFFVAQGHRYTLRKLWLDENGAIQG